MFISYGARVLNALSQYWKKNIAWPIQYRPLGWSRSGFATSLPIAGGPAVGANDYNAALNVYTPGFIKSYDWLADQVLAPVVAAETFTAEEWQQVRWNRLATLYNVGIVVPQDHRSRRGMRLLMGGWNLEDLIGRWSL
ncbi:hypothetical protein QYM36_011570 [Artemia franciscana]|uniref:Uncharacterized protein n=1 Tax=Artemia franciscana TaxID=6661 RepID=A0AA88HVH7_ARTSF|nr:hypothetical protein QYM36_011570 [Artemia franciscana]